MNNNVPNPLLAKLPHYPSPESLRDALTYHPLDGIDVSKLSFMEKDAFLSGEKTIFSPTRKSMLAALTWHGMLITGLTNRDPTRSHNKQAYFQEINSSSLNGYSPKQPTKGMAINLIKGPTGTGKTTIIQRFCACFPQVIEHGKNDEAGWIHHKQLVYLDIDLSHDGARSGLIYAILSAMDNALGTQYATTLTRQNRTIDKLAVATYGRLIAHHTGIIFIDESQLRNLVKSGQAELVQLFLLQLMNIGIPLVISGNEKAFDWLTYSQDLSRLSLTSTVHFHPIGALLDDEHGEWSALARGIMAFYVLNGTINDYISCSQKLRECSGGIARLGLILWSQAQRDCLFEGRESVTAEDIQRAYLSYSFKSIKALADGFRFKNALLLSQYPDIDSDFYASHWHSRLESTAPINATAAPDSNPNGENNTSTSKQHSTRTERAKLKSKQTSTIKRAQKSAELLSSLSENDMRVNGLLNHNLSQLAELREKLEGGD